MDIYSGISYLYDHQGRSLRHKKFFIYDINFCRPKCVKLIFKDTDLQV